MGKALVGILMGSDSDFPVIKGAFDIFKEFGIEFEAEVASAHRTPEKVSRFLKTAEERGLKVILAAAGGAAHLAGVAASKTLLPVLGIPIPTLLGGLDSLLSTVQMPGGIPVATFGVGKGGAKNAALMAVSILALSDSTLSERLDAFRKNMAEEVEVKSGKLKKLLSEQAY